MEVWRFRYIKTKFFLGPHTLSNVLKLVKPPKMTRRHASHAISVTLSQVFSTSLMQVLTIFLPQAVTRSGVSNNVITFSSFIFVLTVNGPFAAGLRTTFQSTETKVCFLSILNYITSDEVQIITCIFVLTISQNLQLIRFDTTCTRMA